MRAALCATAADLKASPLRPALVLLSGSGGGGWSWAAAGFCFVVVAGVVGAVLCVSDGPLWMPGSCFLRRILNVIVYLIASRIPPGLHVFPSV